jgi:predicted RNase H-like HicB family nuclease
MLTAYLAAALRQAEYEILPDNEGFFGRIPALPGVWGNAPTLEETREEVREALEGWLALALARGVPIPAIDGVGIALVAAP